MNLYREAIETDETQSFRLLRWEGSLRRVQACLGWNRSVPIRGSGERWHAHNAIELTYIHSGVGTRFIGDHIGAIEPPELVLLGADLPHYWSGLEDSNGFAVQIDLGSQSQLGRLREFNSLRELWSSAAAGLLFPGSVAIEMESTFTPLVSASPLSQLAELLRMFERLNEARVSATVLCEKPFALFSQAAHADKISSVIDLLLNHYAEALRVDDLAEAVGLSRSTLCRYFRRYTGRSVVTFLNAVRIDQARRLLIETTLPVSEIALQVGFENLSHFNRQFRRRVGAPPRAFRRTAGNSQCRSQTPA